MDRYDYTLWAGYEDSPEIEWEVSETGDWCKWSEVRDTLQRLEGLLEEIREALGT